MTCLTSRCRCAELCRLSLHRGSGMRTTPGPLCACDPTACDPRPRPVRWSVVAWEPGVDTRVEWTADRFSVCLVPQSLVITRNVKLASDRLIAYPGRCMC